MLSEVLRIEDLNGKYYLLIKILKFDTFKQEGIGCAVFFQIEAFPTRERKEAPKTQEVKKTGMSQEAPESYKIHKAPPNVIVIVIISGERRPSFWVNISFLQVY